jgi:uncharacterized protein YbaP (TraB family)
MMSTSLSSGRTETTGVAETARGDAWRALRSSLWRYARVLVCAALVCGRAEAASARDFLWKVGSASGSVYLVGSVHLLTKDFYPLSAALDRAFKDADLLVEEVDLAELLTPAAQMQMLSRGMLPPNTSLDAVVSPATFALVTKRAGELGLPVEPLKRFKPWSLALMLASLQWQKAGFDGDIGLDRHFFDQAKAEGKATLGLETTEFQISRFDGIPMEQQEHLLNETLNDLDSELSNLTTLVASWKAGDAEAVERIVLADVKDEPIIYQRLLVERNRNWLPQIEQFLARPKPAFIVVGAAHLVGPDGLLALLKARGYRVEQQ